MKVCLCTEIMYPLYGVERRVYEMAKRLPDYGWDIEVITSSSASHFPGMNITQASQPTIVKPPQRSSINCINFMLNSYKKIKNGRYDIIDANGHLSLIPAYYAAKGRPLIGTIHDVYGDKWKDIYGGNSFFGKKIENHFLGLKYTRIITINNTLQDYLEKRMLQKVDVIPSGIDTKQIRKIRAGKREKKILYAGRLVKQKNIDMLVRAFAASSAKESHCLKIVGEGSERQRLEKLAQEKGADIEFTGKLENYDDVIREMKTSSFLVLPSIRENFGIVPLESMFCGTPVISTDTDGPRDYIRNGRNGFIVKTEAELAGKMDTMAKNAGRMRSTCISTAKKYDWDTIIKRISGMYEDVLR